MRNTPEEIEKNRQRTVQYYQRHKERVRQQILVRYHETKPRKLAQRKARRQTQTAEQREQKRLYALANYRKNRERCQANLDNSRQKRRGVPGKITLQEWRDRLAEFNHHCAYCLAPFDPTVRPKQVSKDHMQPLAKGGRHLIENVVPACRQCNTRKSARTLLETLSGFPSTSL
jgi:5-methylcytosine-specific restriction endonuclease McrA